MPCGYLKINGLEDGNDGWISILAVASAFQRKGIGKYAVSYAESFFKKQGKLCVKIHTTTDNLEVAQAADVLIIDEISMCRFDLFTQIVKNIETENNKRKESGYLYKGKKKGPVQTHCCR